MIWLGFILLLLRTTRAVSNCPSPPVQLVIAADTTILALPADQPMTAPVSTKVVAVSGHFKASSFHALDCRQTGLMENYIFTIFETTTTKRYSLVAFFDGTQSSIYLVGRDATGNYMTCCSSIINAGPVFVAASLDFGKKLSYVAANQWSPANSLTLSSHPDFTAFRDQIGALTSPRIRVGGTAETQCFTGKLFSWKMATKDAAGFSIAGYLDKDRYVDAVVEYFTINPLLTLGQNQKFIYDPNHPTLPNEPVAKCSSTFGHGGSGFSDYTHEEGKFSFISPKQAVVLNKVLPSPEMTIGEGYNFIISGGFSVKSRTSTNSFAASECSQQPSSNVLDWFAVYNFKIENQHFGLFATINGCQSSDQKKLQFRLMAATSESGNSKEYNLAGTTALEFGFMVQVTKLPESGTTDFKFELTEMLTNSVTTAFDRTFAFEFIGPYQRFLQGIGNIAGTESATSRAHAFKFDYWYLTVTDGGGQASNRRLQRRSR